MTIEMDRRWTGAVVLSAALMGLTGCNSTVGLDSSAVSKNSADLAVSADLAGRDIIVTGNIMFKGVEPFETRWSGDCNLLRFDIRTSPSSEAAQFTIVARNNDDVEKAKSGAFNGEGYIEGTLKLDSKGQAIITLGDWRELHLNHAVSIQASGR